MKSHNVSSKKRQWLAVVLFTVIIIAGLTACSSTTQSSVSPAAAECPVCEEPVCPEPVRYEDVWASSPHADAQAEAFTHWNEENPQEIPADCAKCHSKPGFLDFLGVDGTIAGQVDKPAIIGTTVSCFVCHNEATDDLDSAIFPAGTIVRKLGVEARCIQCHQGRASTLTVDAAIEELSLLDADTPSSELGFINSHSISGATPFGSEVKGAYQYAENSYKGRYIRGEEFFACVECHDQHSLQLDFESCKECHTFASSDPKDIRVDTTDYDGDGDLIEGIAFEISTIHEALYAAIQAYARQVVGTPIAYDLDTHPYFFIDQNNNGEVDSAENTADNRYNQWTPRLLRAAYNYNYVTHDPGAYAHNSDYILQVLFDSLVDIGGDVTGMTRP